MNNTTIEQIWDQFENQVSWHVWQQASIHFSNLKKTMNKTTIKQIKNQVWLQVGDQVL